MLNAICFAVGWLLCSVVGLVAYLQLLSSGVSQVFSIIVGALAALFIGLLYNLVASVTKSIKPLTINPAIDILLSIF